MYCTSFSSFLKNFVGGQENCIKILSEKEPLRHPWPFCCLPPMTLGRRWYWIVKRCILQFVVMKPIITFISLILELFDVYGYGELTPTKGYFWMAIVLDDLTISIAVYSLIIFYLPLADELEPYRPIPKYLCIKFVIFFAFWQGIIISLLAAFDIVADPKVSLRIQDATICVEMFFISIAHAYAFGYSQYRDSSSVPILEELKTNPIYTITPVLQNLWKVLNVRDVVNDTIDTFGREKAVDAPEFTKGVDASDNEGDSDEEEHEKELKIREKQMVQELKDFTKEEGEVMPLLK